MCMECRTAFDSDGTVWQGIPCLISVDVPSLAAHHRAHVDVRRFMDFFDVPRLGGGVSKGRLAVTKATSIRL